MQVARALEPRKRTIVAKSIEMFRAFQLEWKYDKDEILQLYLNLVPYGGNIEGVKAASLFIFQKRSRSFITGGNHGAIHNTQPAFFLVDWEKQ